MKNFKIVLFLAALFVVGTTFSSCGEKATTEDNTEEAATEEATSEEATTDAEVTEDNAEEATEEATEGNEGGEVDKSGKEYTSAYICPMHCEGSGGAEAGKCPACGMDYVANEHYGHDHE